MAQNQNNNNQEIDDMDLSDVKETSLDKGLSLDKSPFHVHCKKCGTVAQYDIINQTYKCKACGQLTGLTEAKNDLKTWRKIRIDTRESISGIGLEKCSCPTCGANIIFKFGEASQKCAFCASNVVRASITEQTQLPDTIIPFKITDDEARSRFKDWAQKNKNTKEAKQVLNNLGDIKKYYLPFRLVRGPIEGKVDSFKNDIKEFPIKGFSQTIAVSAISQMDNLLLNQIEPFEWSELKPFEYAYIGGVPVMLAQDSDYKIAQTMKEEIQEDILPDIRKQLSCTWPSVDIKFGELLKMNALLPVYFIKRGKFYAVLNGQTGKIAATSNNIQKKGIPWWVEAIFLVILLGLITYFSLGANLDDIGLSIAVALTFAIPFCVGMKQSYQGNEAIISRIIRKSRESNAKRKDGSLIIIEKNKILENPFMHKVVFMEDKNAKNPTDYSNYKSQPNSQIYPVRMKIFTGWRIFFFILNSIKINFLPVILAVLIKFFRDKMTLSEAFDSLNLKMMAAYWCISVFLTFIYWIKGMRDLAYQRPVIFELDKDGKIICQSSKSFGHNLKLIHMISGLGINLGCVSIAVYLIVLLFVYFLFC